MISFPRRMGFIVVKQAGNIPLDTVFPVPVTTLQEESNYEGDKVKEMKTTKRPRTPRKIQKSQPEEKYLSKCAHVDDSSSRPACPISCEDTARSGSSGKLNRKNCDKDNLVETKHLKKEVFWQSDSEDSEGAISGETKFPKRKSTPLEIPVSGNPGSPQRETLSRPISTLSLPDLELGGVAAENLGILEPFQESHFQNDDPSVLAKHELEMEFQKITAENRNSEILECPSQENPLEESAVLSDVPNLDSGNYDCHEEEIVQDLMKQLKKAIDNNSESQEEEDSPQDLRYSQLPSLNKPTQSTSNHAGRDMEESLLDSGSQKLSSGFQNACQDSQGESETPKKQKPPVKRVKIPSNNTKKLYDFASSVNWTVQGIEKMKVALDLCSQTNLDMRQLKKWISNHRPKARDQDGNEQKKISPSAVELREGWRQMELSANQSGYIGSTVPKSSENPIDIAGFTSNRNDVPQSLAELSKISSCNISGNLNLEVPENMDSIPSFEQNINSWDFLMEPSALRRHQDNRNEFEKSSEDLQRLFSSMEPERDQRLRNQSSSSPVDLSQRHGSPFQLYSQAHQVNQQSGKTGEGGFLEDIVNSSKKESQEGSKVVPHWAFLSSETQEFHETQENKGILCDQARNLSWGSIPSINLPRRATGIEDSVLLACAEAVDPTLVEPSIEPKFPSPLAEMVGQDNEVFIPCSETPLNSVAQQEREIAHLNSGMKAALLKGFKAAEEYIKDVSSIYGGGKVGLQQAIDVLSPTLFKSKHQRLNSQGGSHFQGAYKGGFPWRSHIGHTTSCLQNLAPGWEHFSPGGRYGQPLESTPEWQGMGGNMQQLSSGTHLIGRQFCCPSEYKFSQGFQKHPSGEFCGTTGRYTFQPTFGPSASEKRMARKTETQRKRLQLRRMGSGGSTGKSQRGKSGRRTSHHDEGQGKKSGLQRTGSSLKEGVGFLGTMQKTQEERKLFEKVLTASDTNHLGRIVLPKGPAEEFLPKMEDKEGMLLVVEDSNGGQWCFRYRYWPNNKSKMYVLEHAGEFLRTFDLKAGDTLLFCRSIMGHLIMRENKTVWPTFSQVETMDVHDRAAEDFIVPSHEAMRVHSRAVLEGLEEDSEMVHLERADEIQANSMEPSEYLESMNYQGRVEQMEGDEDENLRKHSFSENMICFSKDEEATHTSVEPKLEVTGKVLIEPFELFKSSAHKVGEKLETDRETEEKDEEF